MKKLIVATMALAIGMSATFAATYTWTGSGPTYTIVEIDPFADGGTAGNTTAVGGGFFSAASQSETTMRDRTVGPFNTGYEGISGATDRVFDNTVAGPEIITTVSGLVPGEYEVFVVYLYADPEGPQGDNAMGLQAKLNGAVDGTVYNVLNITEKMADNSNPSWAVGLAPIGTTATNATGFTVNLDDAETADPAQDRIDYIGVAYASFIDSDNDGMEDNWETANGLIVGVDDSALDPDSDTLTNLQEYNLGTDPQDDDTDDDGLKDGVETDTGTYVSPSNTGTDPLKADTDGDHYSDGLEVDEGSDPTDPNSLPPSAPIFVSVAVDLSNISPASAVVPGANLSDDNLWGQRDGFGETGATILEGWNDGEDVPVLTQALTGLVAGKTYDVYVNHVKFSATAEDPDGNNGSIRGSLDNSTWILFDAAGGTPGVVGFSELTGFANADRVGLRGYLGTAVANGSGEINVYVDDDGLGGAINQRVWYDGASYVALDIDILPATILSITPAGGDVMKIVIDAPSAAKNYWPQAKSNLIIGSWDGVAHSVDGSDPWLVTNLTYVTEFESTTNEVIYVQASDAQKFFGIGE